jgi:hypothetical protein
MIMDIADVLVVDDLWHGMIAMPDTSSTVEVVVNRILFPTIHGTSILNADFVTDSQRPNTDTQGLLLRDIQSTWFPNMD